MPQARSVSKLLVSRSSLVFHKSFTLVKLIPIITPVNLLVSQEKLVYLGKSDTAPLI